MVQKKVKTVIWSKNAEIQYYKILEYLHEESPEIIKTIASNLLDTIEELSLQYHSYPPDRFKQNNDGTYKAALIFNYRISYKIEETTIRILRIRHTSREPLMY
jgi:plasmid stabilization system protein ParE